MRVKGLRESGILFTLRKKYGPGLGDFGAMHEALTADPEKLADRLFPGGVIPL